MEKIICDADLDYLGRADFFEISDSFFKELKEYKYLNNKSQWDKLQVFLKLIAISLIFLKTIGLAETKAFKIDQRTIEVRKYFFG